MEILWKIYIFAQFLVCLLKLCDAKGNSFAVAFPPTTSNSLEGTCQIYISSDIYSLATIIDIDGTVTNTTIWPELPRVLTFSPSTHRTEGGIENKAIYIKSEYNVSVMLSNARNDGRMDNTIALPLNDGIENKYFILSYPTNVSDGYCITGSATSTYTVVATQDNTMVNIYQYAFGGRELVETVVLDRGQAYTNSSYKDGVTTDFDFTGFYIETDKAISVTAGNPCTNVNQDKSSGPTWSSMPAVQNVGTMYITHPITYPSADSNPYLVRVLALNDTTDVLFITADMTKQLNAGEYYDYIVPHNKYPEMIECSKPCMVAQHSIHFDTTAIFMANLPSRENFVSDTDFALSNDVGFDLSYFLSIVFDTQNPDDFRLFLNGVDLSLETWIIHPLGFSYLEVPLEVQGGTYFKLTSEDPDKKFSALVFAHGFLGQGYGYIADATIITGDSAPDRNDTEPPPTQGQNATYLINLAGNFRSSDGSDFDSVCTALYEDQMQNEAASQVNTVNGMIGYSLCVDLSTDIVSLTSSTATLSTNADQGNTAIQYRMRSTFADFGPPEHEFCGIEITNYLKDHGNWDNPVLDPEPGCPDITFDSNSFNNTGNEWVCEEDKLMRLSGGYPKHQAGAWIYLMDHVGSYFTENEEDLPSQCLESHNSNFEASTDYAVSTVNTMIASGQMCAVSTVRFTVDSAILSSSTPNTGISVQRYIVDYPPEISTKDLTDCASEVSAYLSPHSNWEQPILPPVTDCPNLEFYPEEFEENQKGWFCTEVAK